jgi:hypothetical protein
MIDIWLALIIGAILLLVEAMVMIIMFCTKYPQAGTILVDPRRSQTKDGVSIESPRNLSQWSKYKMLRFDVEVLQFYENARENVGLHNAENSK